MSITRLIKKAQDNAMRTNLTEAVLNERHRAHRLDLSHLGLEAQDILSIIAYLNTHSEITDLDLSWNRIGAEGAGAFAKKNTIAAELDISGNLCITPKVHRRVADSLNALRISITQHSLLLLLFDVLE